MRIPFLLVLTASLLTQLSHGQSSAFTYQGKLQEDGAPVSGTYDLRFSLYNDPVAGSMQGEEQTFPTVDVTNGLFTVTLDFGTNVFSGEDRWLQIGVRTNGGVISAPLFPRQRIAATPYAIKAISADNAANVTGAVAASSITGTISDAQLSTNVALLNSNVTFTGTITATNLVGVWKLGGNAGTTGNDFLGTLDNQPVEFRVNNRAALRLEPSSDPVAPNIISGSPENTAASGIRGAHVAGGGVSHTANHAQSDYSTVGGGRGHSIGGNAIGSTINGGSFHTIGDNSTNSVVGGGGGNSLGLDTRTSTIAGGSTNRVYDRSFNSTISGGFLNQIYSDAFSSTISGGSFNAVGFNSPHSVVAGGFGNTITDLAGSSVISGGVRNAIHTNAPGSVIAGGTNNLISQDAYSSTISGGMNNIIESNAWLSSVGGGNDNAVRSGAWLSTIGGGALNLIDTNAVDSTIGGGVANKIYARAPRSTIAGGFGNVIGTDAWDSSIGGGNANTVLTGAKYATIPGGRGNVASAQYTFAAGYQARAIHQGSFVWADAIDLPFASTAANQFNVRASAGARFNSDTNSQTIEAGSAAPVGTWVTINNTAAGGKPWSMISSGPGNGEGAGKLLVFDGSATRMQLDNGGLTVNGTFVSSSDRNRKENFVPVNSREILEKVSALPLSSWNYKEDKESRHLGPMAQDFQKAFGVGPDDKHIATVDADGVALAAIQGLNEKLTDEARAKDQALKALQTQNQTLEKRIGELEEIVKKLAQKAAVTE